LIRNWTEAQKLSAVKKIIETYEMYGYDDDSMPAHVFQACMELKCKLISALSWEESKAYEPLDPQALRALRNKLERKKKT